MTWGNCDIELVGHSAQYVWRHYGPTTSDIHERTCIIVFCFITVDELDHNWRQGHQVSYLEVKKCLCKRESCVVEIHEIYMQVYNCGRDMTPCFDQFDLKTNNLSRHVCAHGLFGAQNQQNLICRLSEYARVTAWSTACHQIDGYRICIALGIVHY